MKPLRRNFCTVLFICNANILIGAWRARHAGCYFDVSRWRRFGTDTPTTSFLDFSRLEHALAAHEHTEQPTTLLRRRNMMSALCLWTLIPGLSSTASHCDRNYSHGQYTWLHLVDRRRAVVQFSSGPSVASKKFCKNRLSSCCPASSCDGYSMEEQLTNARLCHYIFNPLIKPCEWQISPWNQGRTEDFVIEET